MEVMSEGREGRKERCNGIYRPAIIITGEEVLRVKKLGEITPASISTPQHLVANSAPLLFFAPRALSGYNQSSTQVLMSWLKYGLVAQ